MLKAPWHLHNLWALQASCNGQIVLCVHPPRCGRCPPESGLKLSLFANLQRVDASAADGAPWNSGHRAAKRIRSELGVDPKAPFAALPSVVLTRPAERNFGVGSAGCLLAGATAVVLPRDRGRSATRFLQARSLWHAAVVPTFVLTDAGEWNQQAGRAFAAELLAPAEGIRDLVDPIGPRFGPEDAELVAEHFGVSEFVINHQLENHTELW